MKRKAILIESSNVKGQTDLPGARKDVENWRNFLISDLGGSWSAVDITILSKPLSAEVKKALDVSRDTYCFVAFSGHGNDGSVALNDYRDNFSIDELRPQTDQGTLIIDSCRGEVELAERVIKSASAVGMVNESIKASLRSGRTMIFNSVELGQLRNFSYSSTYERQWEEALAKSAKGIVKMYSCSKGEGAGENPNAGGYYTTLLMQAAEEFSRTENVGSVQTTKQAHDYAALMLLPQQNPEYSPSWLSFPFAVSL